MPRSASGTPDLGRRPIPHAAGTLGRRGKSPVTAFVANQVFHAKRGRGLQVSEGTCSQFTKEPGGAIPVLQRNDAGEMCRAGRDAPAAASCSTGGAGKEEAGVSELRGDRGCFNKFCPSQTFRI